MEGGRGEVCAVQENTRWIRLDFSKAQDQESHCYVGLWDFACAFQQNVACSLACWQWLMVVRV